MIKSTQPYRLLVWFGLLNGKSIKNEMDVTELLERRNKQTKKILDDTKTDSPIYNPWG